MGASFYFIALDYALVPPSDDRREREGVGGESWEIHGGGFYRVEKFRVAPTELPSSLRWFKWEAYTTWLSGFALLVLLYYLDPATYLIDRAVADLAPWQAIAASLALLAGGWLAYDGLSRALAERPRLLALAIALLVALVALVAGALFSPRAAFIQTGAVIGTWMAANVLFVIIPGQRELVAAKQAGREVDARYGIRGKQRSVHNNYLTLPAVFAMISQHFPMTYAGERPWLVLLALLAAGAAVRHFFNLRHQGRVVWAIPAATAIGVVALAIVLAPPSLTSAPITEAELPAVQAVFAQRCVTCHSSLPTYPGIATAPKGVTFDTPQQQRDNARRVYQQVVVSRNMPFGNVTAMTAAERELIARWVVSGAP